MDNGRGGHQATAEEHEIELIKQQLLPSMSEDIEAQLNESARESRWSIFKVPEALAEGFAEACRPRIVSIGPYHHGETRLQKFQGYKLRCLHTMLNRTQPHGISLENLIDVVAQKEEMIRQCYSESTDDFSRPDLVKMMVLDGCFITEYLRGTFPDSRVVPSTNRFVSLSIARDLLRLENQVPYFVLEELFRTTNAPEGTLSLADLAFIFFEGFWEETSYVHQRQTNLNGVHLLDLFRLSLKPSDQEGYSVVDKTSSFHLTRSASELHRVGIRFKQIKTSTFLDIKLDRKRRAVGIPKIAVDDYELDWLLINMIAFEQCCGQEEGHVTAYASFMGCLIRTAQDVRLLRDCKVISNFGRSNEDFVRFFSDICKDVSIDPTLTYLSSHIAILNESPKYERAYLCWVQLVNAFQDNPWSALSALALIVTLVGMIQTVYTVLQYYHPK